MSDRRKEDNNFIDSCKESQARANKTLSLIDTFMSSILTSVRDLDKRVTVHENDTKELFKEIFGEHKAIKEEQQKLFSEISDIKTESKIGFESIESMLTAQCEQLNSLSKKEKVRSRRELWVKGAFVAVIMCLSTTGTYFIGIQLFGEDNVQKAIDVSRGKIIREKK